MISLETAFFHIFASVFVQNSLFSYLITWFRSKHLFFVSVHMISFKTPFFRICTHDFVRNSLFQHLCFCFRSKHLFFVSVHMISFKTAFFNIFASVFVQNTFFSFKTHDFVRNSLFQHLCFCFRSKHLFSSETSLLTHFLVCHAVCDLALFRAISRQHARRALWRSTSVRVALFAQESGVHERHDRLVVHYFRYNRSQCFIIDT